MHKKSKASFFEKLTGTVNLGDDITGIEVEEVEEEEEEIEIEKPRPKMHKPKKHHIHNTIVKEIEEEILTEDEVEAEIEEEESESDEDEGGELAVDVYQTDGDIVVQAMIAGVRPDEISVSITRDMVIIKGERSAPKNIPEDSYFSKELYWGSFSRKINLPEEVDADEAEAFEKHGLLMLKLPKLDKSEEKKLRVQST